MKQQFKTNINCSGCVAKVTPFLNGKAGIKTWEVDTNNPSKVLTVESEGLSEDQIMQVVREAGFKIEPINN